MEAAACGKKAIALSYAFYSREHDPEVIAAASKLSVKLVEHFFHNWDKDVDLYTVNVPLIKGVENNKVMWTYTLQNYWTEGSSFQEVEAAADTESADVREHQIRETGEEDKMGEQAVGPAKPVEASKVTRHQHKHFRWAPKFTDVAKSVEESGPGNDGWALGQGYTSVTPLKANFMHPTQHKGELKL